MVAVGSDREGTLAAQRAEALGIPTFVVSVKDFADRSEWDAALTKQVEAFDPTIVVLAGFMKLMGEHYLERLGARTVNSHPALSPSFPGMHGARDALDYGVKVTGCTLFVIDKGVDTGPIVAQASVPVLPADDEASLHERIKVAERALLVDTIGQMAREGFTVSGRRVTIP